VGTILVSGLINLETTLRVDAFPIQYQPVRYPFFGIHQTISGVGYNIARALTILGETVTLASMIGSDPTGALAQMALAKDGIPDDLIVQSLAQTPASVILYDSDGRRQINVDLKNIQDTPFPRDLFLDALAGCSLAVLCNINFSRPFLQEARQRGKLVATDVHTISDLDDPYNRDFMQHADILFMSDEALPCTPEDWAHRVRDRYGTAIIVIGLGKQGALLSVKQDGFIERIPAVHIRPVINTIGAGDALFSAFLHVYSRTGSPYEALQKAIVFAAYKIGENGAANGFLSSEQLTQIAAAVHR
jgi:ribokinase